MPSLAMVSLKTTGSGSLCIKLRLAAPEPRKNIGPKRAVIMAALLRHNADPYAEILATAQTVQIFGGCPFPS